jgi:hypothetical protein
MPRSQIVMADAQFGTERFMRPNADFTDQYAGENALNNPIWLFPNGQPLDPQAGRPGYDPNLIRGLSVPVGARLILKMPSIVYTESTVPLVFRSYIWAFFWRERNLFDYRTQRIPWHLPAGRGPDNTMLAPPAPRVTLPVASNTVVYNQAEPISVLAPDSGRAIQRARAEDIRFSAANLAGPILPSGATGVVQQGVLDPGDFGVSAGQQLFMNHEIQALEDELLIAVYRNTGPTNWDFTVATGADDQLGQLLGNTGAGADGDTARVGVYVKAGSAP